MKTFILCGGFGTRLDYEGKVKAKPMVKIGNKPILMYIIENFCRFGIDEFIFCLGYKSDSIINYFLKTNKKKIAKLSKTKNCISFKYKDKNLSFNGNLCFTGIKTGTGGRILQAYKMLKLNEDIMMTYGDGLSNVNLNKLIKCHYKNKSEVTLTAVRPKQRFGVLKISNNRIKYFDNSKDKSDVYINGGFFVISKNAIKIIKDKKIYWEKEPLSFFLKRKKLYAYKHEGFWKSLDTLKDKNDFNEMVKRKKFPWKT